ncbi:MAG: bacteriohemerythrin [Sulfuricurvum sp.]|nr:bacteriohemerythrin [Sulfuricurvum sp.]
MPHSFAWREEYRLGINSIDQQHRHLFEIVERIAKLDAASSSKEELRQILGELSQYMREHFSDEESYMESIQFPELEQHRKIHQDIIEFFNHSISNSPTIAMIQTKLKFIIKKALIEHIVSEDIKIKLYSMKKKELVDDYSMDLD